MSSSFAGKTVLITGGTGSFGSTMAAHALKNGVEELRIFSRDEAKQDAMRHIIGNKRVKFIIGDTRDEQSVSQAMRGVNLVFHAAALKQVPSAEFFPLQAVKTNINGSANVLMSAIESRAEAVVCLSTDKAVYPINAMGMSKALMEKTAQAFAREYQDSDTKISVTRYGNVMYSRGSVIPLFESQIRAGGPITLTDPEMTRFIMSLQESVDLVEYAFKFGQGGDIFVRKASASTILQLAEALKEILEAKTTPVKVIGQRHGEKLYESLLSSEERARSEDLGQYFRVPLDARDLNYEQYFEQGSPLEPDLEPYTSHNTNRLSTGQVIETLISLPEFGNLGKS